MCVEMTDDVFPEVTGRLFVQSAFGREERDNVRDLNMCVFLSFFPWRCSREEKDNVGNSNFRRFSLSASSLISFLFLPLVSHCLISAGALAGTC